MSDGSPPTGDRCDRRRYERRIANISNLPELQMRSASVRRALTELEPRVALVWLDRIVRGAIRGRTNDLEVAVALAFWLVNSQRSDQEYAFLEDVYRRAHEWDVDSVLSLLRNAPPHREMRAESDLPEVRLPIDRDPEEITVGERRSMAMGADAEIVDRLVLDPNPLVVRNLLDNPDLTEQKVLRIASRRPTDPCILQEVAAHRDWFTRHEVRAALVQNPYHRTGDSLALLPTIGLQTLHRLRHGSDLHPLVTDAASHYVDIRETYA